MNSYMVELFAYMSSLSQYYFFLLGSDGETVLRHIKPYSRKHAFRKNDTGLHLHFVSDQYFQLEVNYFIYFKNLPSYSV